MVIHMKKNIIKTIALIFILGFRYTSVEAMENEKPILQIPVMSDIHISNQDQEDRFKKALEDYKVIAPDYKAIALVGDITNQGSLEQYNNFMKILEENSYDNSEKIIAMGNHEYGEIWNNPNADDSVYLNRFAENTKESNVYFDSWVSGYHFIVLGGEKLGSSNGDEAVISDAQYDWLEKTIAVDADQNKPIFVFLHQPLPNTVYGSEYWNSTLTDGRLAGILKKYPQTILFSGHSHNLLNHPRTVYQDGFTMVNTGAVAYTWYNGGYGPSSYSQGLLVNVYKDRVEIKAREFSNGTWINTFEIKTPFEQTIYDNEKPRFGINDSLKITNIDEDSASVYLSNAEDNTQVDGYVVKVNGRIVKTEYLKFWEGKDTFNFKLSGLLPDTVYNIEVYAKDAWQNLSEAPLKSSFKTKRVYGWYYKDGKWYYYDPNTGEKRTGWILYNNNWYYLDEKGVMKTDWYMDKNNNWYYLNEDGSMKTGWLLNNRNWYFLNKDGSMHIGWSLDTDRNWYYLDYNGTMKTGWLQEKSHDWYYLDNSGAMKTGWVLDNSSWYYLDRYGLMRTGWIMDKKKWFLLDKNGVWIQ